MKHARFAPLLGLALLLGCPGGDAAEDASSRRATRTPSASAKAYDGKKLYVASCSACHGVDARGLPNLGKDMVASEFVRSRTDEQLLEFVKKGRAADDPRNTTSIPMPPRGGNPALNDDKILAVIQYIRSLQG